MSAPRVAWPDQRFTIGDRVRWREADLEARALGIVRLGPWVYGRVRYVYENGTTRVRSDAGDDDDRHPYFERLELVSAVDQLADLLQ